MSESRHCLPSDNKWFSRNSADSRFDMMTRDREFIEATFERWKAERADAIRRRMRKLYHKQP